MDKMLEIKENLKKKKKPSTKDDDGSDIEGSDITLIEKASNGYILKLYYGATDSEEQYVFTDREELFSYLNKVV